VNYNTVIRIRAERLDSIPDGYLLFSTSLQFNG